MITSYAARFDADSYGARILPVWFGPDGGWALLCSEASGLVDERAEDERGRSHFFIRIEVHHFGSVIGLRE
jgi:hypothetical protein